MVDPPFSNVYHDATRAASYATLEFPGTYYLAFRDLPVLLRTHRSGSRAVDFGCGTGRSTRFLRSLGFDVVGLDISRSMIDQARARDPGGDYRLIAEGETAGLPESAFDLVLSAFTFDNIPTVEKKVALLGGLGRLLHPGGRLVNLVSTPEIYLHEWASFSTRDFPGNRDARCGDRVRIVMLDVPDRRPVEDIVWTDEGYREVYRKAGLRVLDVHRPLGRPDEGHPWVSETRISPWAIYLLEPEG